MNDKIKGFETAIKGYGTTIKDYIEKTVGKMLSTISVQNEVNKYEVGNWIVDLSEIRGFACALEDDVVEMVVTLNTEDPEPEPPAPDM